MDDSNRHIDKVRAIALHGASQTVHELRHPVVRDEIFLQDVGVPQAVVQIVHRIVHFLVARHEAAFFVAHRFVARYARVQPRLAVFFHYPANPPAGVSRLRKIDDKAVQPHVTRQFQRNQRHFHARFLVRMNRGFTQKSRGRHGQPPVSEPGIRIALDVFCVVAREILVIHIIRFPEVHLVLDDVEIRVEDNAHQPVAAERMMKQLRIFRRAAILDLSVAQQDSKRAYRRRHLARIVRDAVRVHAKRSAHRENINGLHGFDRKAVLVKVELQLFPRCPGLHIENLVLFVEPHLIEPTHVQHESILNKGVASHAVPRARGGDFQFVLARELQRVLQILHRRNFDDAVNRGLVQVAGIINVTAHLFERHLRRRRDLHHQCRRLGLIGIRGIDEVGFFVFRGRGGVVKKLLRGDDQQRRH